jgi:predicted RNA-binding Zn-ribbon protein involved in translation (DUF1610 family)
VPLGSIDTEAIISFALRLHDLGFNVIPIVHDEKGEKRPLVDTWSAHRRMPRRALEKALKRAHGIAIVAGPHTYAQLQPAVALAIIDVDDPSIIEGSPTLREILSRTVAWYTGPRCSKCCGKELDVLELGARFRCPKCSLDFRVEEAKRGVAALIHVGPDVLQRCLKDAMKKGTLGEVKDNTYQVIPPSLHPTGVRYEWLRPFDWDAPNLGIHAASEDELRAVLRELKLLKERAKRQATSALGSFRELSDDEVIEVKELLRRAYKPGSRQLLWLFLAGWGAKAGVSPVSIAKVLKALYHETGDSDPLRMRAGAIIYSYKKAGVGLEAYSSPLRELLGVEPYGLEREVEEAEVKGRAGLREIIEEALGEEEASRVLGELEGVFGSSPIALPPASEVGETFTYTGDRPFKGRVQVGALTTPLSRFMRLRFKCREPGECKVSTCPLYKGLILDADDPARLDPSAFATYFDTNNPLDALNVYAEKRAFARCAEWRRKVVYLGRGERAVTRALVYDLAGREGLAWFIHGERCDLRRAPNWIIAEGWLCRGHRGRIGVLIQAFTSESEVMAPPLEEVERARVKLKSFREDEGGLEGSNAWRIAELLRLKVNAKGNEVHKGFVGDLLTIGSPTWVKTPEAADRELGATTCELGPSTTFKSQRGRFLVDWLGAGKYLRGRKTEAGLTAGLEKVEGLGWIVKKGALPSADLSFIIVDNMPPHALDDQIESRRDGVVSVHGIKQMELWARARLKLLNNPQQPFDELVYKCSALKMFDPKLVARMAFAIYTYGVSVEERYDPKVFSLTPEEEGVLEAARTVLRWNLSQEVTYEVLLRLWPKVMELSKALEVKYGCEDVPLLLRNIPYKLAVLAYSFALLEGEVEPTERHYELAYGWLDFCARDIELDKYAEMQRELRNLSDQEYDKIRMAIEKDIAEDVGLHGGERENSHLYRFMDYLVKHGKAQCSELAAHLEVDESTVKRKAHLLKGLGLLRSSKDGYAFTPKGVRFVKRWLAPAPDATDATASGAQRGVGPARDKAPSEGVCAPKAGASGASGARQLDRSEAAPTSLEASAREPEGLLARIIDYAYRRRGNFTLGELALALGTSVGEARRAVEVLARRGVLVELDEVTFRAARWLSHG